MAREEGWIGVDLDGTLAYYDEVWRGPTHIGDPIPKMLQRVLLWLAAGQRVKIMTARVSGVENDAQACRVAIEQWCMKHLGQVLEVTCKKDYAMIVLYDDRAVQIIPNTGERADGRP